MTDIEKQLEFVSWLKAVGMYDPLENAHVMQKMYDVWVLFNLPMLLLRYIGIGFGVMVLLALVYL